MPAMPQPKGREREILQEMDEISRDRARLRQRQQSLQAELDRIRDKKREASHEYSGHR